MRVAARVAMVVGEEAAAAMAVHEVAAVAAQGHRRQARCSHSTTLCMWERPWHRQVGVGWVWTQIVSCDGACGDETWRWLQNAMPHTAV